MERYVRCISLKNKSDGIMLFGVLGKVYKIRQEHSELDWYLEGITYSVGKKRFQPATKEEYDLQQQGFYVKDVLVEDTSHEEILIKLLKDIKHV